MCYHLSLFASRVDVFLRVGFPKVMDQMKVYIPLDFVNAAIKEKWGNLFNGI